MMSSESILEPLSKLPSVLPTELVMLILSTAATLHRPTAARLCRVSKWVQNLVEPILYRVLILNNTTNSELLLSPKLHAFTRHLCMIVGSWESLQYSGPPLMLPGIRSFATDANYFDRYVEATQLEELHILAPRVWWSPWNLPQQIRRLHCWFSPNRAPRLVENILGQPRLSHIAFSVFEKDSRSDITLWELKLVVTRLLKEHGPLNLLLVRLRSDGRRARTWMRRRPSITEDTDSYLASIKDPRFVLKHVDLGAEKTEILEEWERNALNGEDIWDQAQLELDLDSMIPPSVI